MNYFTIPYHFWTFDAFENPPFSKLEGGSRKLSKAKSRTSGRDRKIALLSLSDFQNSECQKSSAAGAK